MTIGECIKEFREDHDLSQRQFADMCGLSNAYISMLEKNVNPKTKKPPIPTVGVYKKLANAMRVSIDDLFKKACDSFVSLGSDTFGIPPQAIHPDVMEILDRRIEEAKTAPEKELLLLFQTMTDTDKDKLLDYAHYIVDSYKRPDKRRKE